MLYNFPFRKFSLLLFILFPSIAIVVITVRILSVDCSFHRIMTVRKSTDFSLYGDFNFFFRFTELIYQFDRLLVGCFRFFYGCNMSPANMATSTFFFPVLRHLCSFCFLVVPSDSPSSSLSKRGESGHLCIISDKEEMLSTFSHSTWYLLYIYYPNPLSCEVYFSVSNLLSVFIQKRYWISSCFPFCIRWDGRAFVLHAGNVVCDVYQFMSVELDLYHWD